MKLKITSNFYDVYINSNFLEVLYKVRVYTT